MMRLQALQRAFQARVLTHQPGIEAELDGSYADDFTLRLDAYVDGYRLRLVEALGASYPVLQMTLGSPEFTRCMRAYIDATPSRHYSVRHYGADLAHRFAETAHLRQDGKLGELARWEWMLADVFDAPDDTPLALSALAAMPPATWPHLCFSLRACVRRFDTSSNIVEWWRSANGLCDQPADLADAEPSRWLLWRRGVRTLFRSLDPVEASILDAAAAGATFGDMCVVLAEHAEESEVALRAVSLLRGWIEEELMAGCRVVVQPPG